MIIVGEKKGRRTERNDGEEEGGRDAADDENDREHHQRDAKGLADNLMEEYINKR